MALPQNMMVKRALGTLAGASQAANVAAAAALTSAVLTVGGTDFAASVDGDVDTLLDPATDAGASVIDGINELIAQVNAINADLVELRTQLNAEIAALKAASLQASS